MVSPAVESIGREDAGRLKVVKVNVDAAPQLSERFEIRGIPLLVLFRDGTEVDRFTGAVPPEALRRWLEPHLAPASEHA
jgi:thioredoxin 2